METTPAALPRSQPVMDIRPPATGSTELAVAKQPDREPDTRATKSESKTSSSETSKVTKPPKVKTPNVTAAIVATVIVVIVLAALMVYAYLRTRNIALF
jgi:hypothetical protein